MDDYIIISSSSLLLLLILLLDSELLLVAPVYSVRADNNPLSKVSQSLAQWHLQLCFFFYLFHFFIIVIIIIIIIISFVDIRYYLYIISIIIKSLMFFVYFVKLTLGHSKSTYAPIGVRGGVGEGTS